MDVSVTVFWCVSLSVACSSMYVLYSGT